MILYLDVFSGISGDMTLGAFVDLGVPPAYIEDQLSPMFNGFGLKVETVYRHHLKATNLFVDVTDHQTSRHYTDIQHIISDSNLSDGVKENSLKAFEKIALAESSIHGKDIKTVHFHEVGAIDSMVDIIGSFLCVEYLGIKTVYSSVIPLGSGFVECAHGKIPVPVPAVTRILEGVPVKGSDAVTEIVTPTGAAIATTLCSNFGPMPDMKILKTGYGAGKRQTGSSLPNLLRLVMGEPLSGRPENKSALLPETEKDEPVYVIHTNLDDITPEILGFVMDRLFDKGALDVSYAPIQMKKNRPGTRLEAIVRPKDLAPVTDTILSETSALGVRYTLWDRKTLKREPVDIETEFGKICFKRVLSLSGTWNLVPEYEQLKDIALKENIPLKAVYARIAAQSDKLGSLDSKGPKG